MECRPWRTFRASSGHPDSLLRIGLVPCGFLAPPCHRCGRCALERILRGTLKRESTPACRRGLSARRSRRQSIPIDRGTIEIRGSGVAALGCSSAAPRQCLPAAPALREPRCRHRTLCAWSHERNRFVQSSGSLHFPRHQKIELRCAMLQCLVPRAIKRRYAGSPPVPKASEFEILRNSDNYFFWSYRQAEWFLGRLNGEMRPYRRC